MTLLAKNQLRRGAGLRFAPRKGDPLLLRRQGAVAIVLPRRWR